MQAQGGPVPDAPSSAGVVNLLSRATSTWLATSVLLALVALSVFTWSIFLFKWWTFRRAQRQSAQFLDVFRRSNKFSEVQAVCRSLNDSPLVGLFQAGYAELTAQLRQGTPADVAETQVANPRASAGRPTRSEERRVGKERSSRWVEGCH